MEQSDSNRRPPRCAEFATAPREFTRRSTQDLRLSRPSGSIVRKDWTEVTLDPLTALVLAAITSGVVEGVSGKIGEAAFKKARAILTTVKERWKGDAVASKELAEFEIDPATYAPAIAQRLDRDIAEDPQLRAKLEALVKSIGPQIEVVQEIARAEGVTGLKAEEMTRGSVSVTQRMEEGVNVTGAQFGKID